MNEQQLADLFSDQIDRLLQGQTADLPPDAADLPGLLTLLEPAVKTEFKVNPIAQAGFEQQLAGWFGLANGGSAMTILGLSKTWFISIVIVVVLISGAGFIGLITTGLFVANSLAQAPALATASPVVTGTVTLTPALTGTVTATPSVTGTVNLTPSATMPAPLSPTITPGTPIVLPPGAPTLIFQQVIINVSHLCRGAYITQSVLLNSGSAAVTDAALVWQVVQGAEFVKGVDLGGPGLIVHDTYADLSLAEIDQSLALDVQIEVNESWWAQPEGTEIKVKLSVENSPAWLPGQGTPEPGDANRGHGNDPDGCDEDNPGQSRCDPADDPQSQIITVVKQSGQGVTLTGLAYQFGAQTLLVDGKTVLINECTALPPVLPPDSGVQIIGILQPDGTFIAVTVILIDIDLIISPPGAHPPPASGDDNDNDDDGGGYQRDGDHDRGHGNDPDGYDEDNPGRGKGHNKKKK